MPLQLREPHAARDVSRPFAGRAPGVRRVREVRSDESFGIRRRRGFITNRDGIIRHHSGGLGGHRDRLPRRVETYLAGHNTDRGREQVSQETKGHPRTLRREGAVPSDENANSAAGLISAVVHPKGERFFFHFSQASTYPNPYIQRSTS